jgi:hypothetical protein
MQTSAGQVWDASFAIQVTTIKLFEINSCRLKKMDWRWLVDIIEKLQFYFFFNLLKNHSFN